MDYFASVLLLNRKDITELGIYDPYSLHKVVYSLFEDIRSTEEKEKGYSSGILFSDEGGDFKSRKVLMLSNRRPKENIEGKYGEVRSKQINREFLESNYYRFKVVINPTKRSFNTRKIVPLRGEKEIASWFVQRAENSWGFKVEESRLRVDKTRVLQFKNKEQLQITLAQVPIYGVLKVIDKERFKTSFKQGVGRGKAFGCGLLQIAPLVEELFD